MKGTTNKLYPSSPFPDHNLLLFNENDKKIITTIGKKIRIDFVEFRPPQVA